MVRIYDSLSGDVQATPVTGARVLLIGQSAAENDKQYEDALLVKGADVTDIHLDTMADLQALNSSDMPGKQVFLRGRSSAWDGGGGLFYLLADDADYSIDPDVYGSYNDTYWHAVDASNRLWGRKADFIIPSQFNITISTSQDDAMAAGDHEDQVQSLMDFWANPWADPGNPRFRGRNTFPGWSKRPKWDQFQRPCIFGPSGYVRCDGTVYFELLELVSQDFGGHNYFRNTSSPGFFDMQAAILKPHSQLSPAIQVSFSTYLLDSPIKLKASKQTQDNGGALGRETYWNTKVYTEAAANCKYPHIPFPDNGVKRNWADITPATTTWRPGDLVSVVVGTDTASDSHGTDTDGSKWLYQFTGDTETTSEAAAPTHTSGTTNDLLCLGMYVTPIVGGGGQHDWDAIAAADQDVGILITGGKDVGRKALFYCDADHFEHQVMVRGENTSGDGRQDTLYGADLRIGGGTNCRFQLSLVLAANTGLNSGLINDCDFNMIEVFRQYDSGSPRFDDDQSVVGAYIFLDPDRENLDYQSNQIRIHRTSVEVSPHRTSPARIINGMNAGHAVKWTDIRNDGNFGQCDFWAPMRGDGSHAEDYDVEFFRTPRIFAGGTNGRFRNLAEPHFSNSLKKHVDLRKFTVHGYGSGAGATDSQVFWHDCITFNRSNGDLRESMLAAQFDWDGANHEFNFAASTYLPGVMFRVHPEGDNRNWGQMIVTLHGRRPQARLYLIPFDDSESALDPTIYDTEEINPGASWHSGWFDDGGMYQTTGHLQTSSNSEGPIRFGIPPWAYKFIVGVHPISRCTGFDIEYNGSYTIQELHSVRQTPSVTDGDPPDMGRFTLPSIAWLREAAAGGETFYYLSHTGGYGGSTYNSDVFYGAYGQYTDSTLYAENMRVHDGLTSGVGDIWKCTVGGTSNGASPGVSTGAEFELEHSGVNVVVPGDWALKGA